MCKSFTTHLQLANTYSCTPNPFTAARAHAPTAPSPRSAAETGDSASGAGRAYRFDDRVGERQQEPHAERRQTRPDHPQHDDGSGLRLRRQLRQDELAHGHVEHEHCLHESERVLERGVELVQPRCLPSASSSRSPVGASRSASSASRSFSSASRSSFSASRSSWSQQKSTWSFPKLVEDAVGSLHPAGSEHAGENDRRRVLTICRR